MATEKVVTNTLISKLADASKLIGPIQKDGENGYQHYTFQSEAAIKAAVKNALDNVGIQIVPSFEVINQYDKTSQKGAVNHFVDVMGTFVITDGTDTITGKMPGSGQDTAEKAMAKACTSAQKYFYKQLFNISDQEPDPDADNSKPDGGFTQQKNQQQQNNPQSTNAPAKRAGKSAREAKIKAILEQSKLLKKVVNNDLAAKSMFNVIIGTNGFESFKDLENASLDQLNAISNGINDAIKSVETENAEKKQKAGATA